MERRLPGAQSGPKAAGTGKETSCLARVGLELPPTQKPGPGPGPGSHTELLAPMRGEKRGFCVWRPLRAPRWAPTFTSQAELSRGLRPALPRERRYCLRLRRSAQWLRLVLQCRCHSQYGITVSLFPRLTWAPRRYGRRWPLFLRSWFPLTGLSPRGPSGAGLNTGHRRLLGRCPNR